jgi:Heparinase II/III-like protein
MMNLLCRRFGMQGPACTGGEPVPPRRPLYAAAMYAFLPPQLPVVPGSSTDAESPLRSWFNDGGVLICRPAAKGPEFALALKGGHNAEHHNHNDVGTFMIVSGQAMVLCDPGAEVYTARTFSARRYESDVLNSFGHPVPMIAGQLQRTGAQAIGEVLRTDFSDARDILDLDLRSAYAVPSLKRLERTFTYQRQPTESVTVADRVEFDAPETFETALITWSPWQRVGDRELLIGDEKGAVRVKIETGGEPFEVKSKRLEADVHTPAHAERIGLALSSPVKSALVTLVITPAVGERQK